MNLYILVKSVMGLSFLWFLVYYLWSDYRIDAFRDHVFSIRDRLFLFAAKGNINFDHAAYAILRHRMNLIIRYAHEVTMTRMMIILLTHKHVKSDSIMRWQQAVEELPEPTREKIVEFNTCLVEAVWQHMVYCSFFRYMLVRPFMTPLQVRIIVDRPDVIERVEILESDAVDQRNERELAVA